MGVFKEITNQKIGDYFSITRQTIGTYKKSNKLLYSALLEYYINHKDDKNAK